MPNDQFSATDLLGSIVDDRFEVLEKLGEGGMGAVYKARQISMDRQVALKILLHDQRGDPISVERFRHEAYLASRLRHPNAIIIHDFGQAPDGLLYIAMEYLSGETLKHRLSRLGPLPVRSAVKILGQTLRTIAEAHRMGLIHRDLKPDNIFLTTVEGDTDYVKVLDFGIAKLTAVQDGIGGYQGGLTVAGKIYGTPNYMSPEQIRGKPVDHQSDLYQLGVIFYEMLAGRRPFEAQTPVDVMMMHLRDAPPPLSQFRSDIPPELENTVLRVLEKDRRLRFQSGDEFLEALENFKFQSGFYNVPARMAAMGSRTDMPAQPQVARSGPVDAPDDSILELGESALMDAMDFVEEKTMLEFDDDGGGFDDPEEKTIFEPDDDGDMVTSADPVPGIASMTAAAAELAAPPRSTLSHGTPREPAGLDVAEDFDHSAPSFAVPIPDIEEAGGRARPAPDRRTIAGAPGATPPRYVTGSPAGGPVPQKPTLAGHPGAVGLPPPRAAAPGSPSTIPHAGPVVPTPRAPTPAPQPTPGFAAPLPPAPEPPSFHPVAAPAPSAVAPSVAGAPAMALTPASDAPDFNLADDFMPQGGGGGKGLILKIVLGLLLVLGTAALVIWLVRRPSGPPPPPPGPVVLQLASVPDKLEIFDGGRYVGETPHAFEVESPTAKYNFRFARQSAFFTAAVDPITEATWAWVKLPDGDEPKTLGTMLVVSDPAGPVSVDGTQIGQTPILIIAPPGDKIDLAIDAGGQSRKIVAETKIGGGRIDAGGP